MARLVYSAIASLDGYIEDLHGEFAWAAPDEEVHSFIDEYHLFLTPIIVGGGKPALPANVRLELELLAERRFDSGVVFLHYRVR